MNNKELADLLLHEICGDRCPLNGMTGDELIDICDENICPYHLTKLLQKLDPELE